LICSGNQFLSKKFVDLIIVGTILSRFVLKMIVWNWWKIQIGIDLISFFIKNIQYILHSILNVYSGDLSPESRVRLFVFILQGPSKYFLAESIVQIC